MAEGSARGEVERREPTKAERAAARRVAESKATIPHLYVTGQLRLSPSHSVLPAIVHAAGRALREAPLLNGSYRDGAYETYSRVNVGVLVTGSDGPVFPTIFDADIKDRAAIEGEWESLAARAADGSLTARDTAGGTFTVQSGFGLEGCAFFPVINAGQAANLGVGSPKNGEIEATIAADARMVPASEAAMFLDLLQGALHPRSDG
jgi:pyruvate dehydrogenase E2 component (dihydrolipoamide acetyltransferase)